METKGSDDERPRKALRSRGPVKPTTKASSDEEGKKKVGWSEGKLDMSPTANATPLPTSGAVPLAPAIKKPSQRGTSPVLKPKGMGDQEQWSAAEWIQNAKIEITVAQLMQIAPRARTSVVDAIRLEPNPNRKAAQKGKRRVTIDEGVQAEEVDSSEACQSEVACHKEVAQEVPEINILVFASKLVDSLECKYLSRRH